MNDEEKKRTKYGTQIKSRGDSSFRIFFLCSLFSVRREPIQKNSGRPRM